MTFGRDEIKQQVIKDIMENDNIINMLKMDHEFKDTHSFPLPQIESKNNPQDMILGDIKPNLMFLKEEEAKSSFPSPLGGLKESFSLPRIPVKKNLKIPMHSKINFNHLEDKQKISSLERHKLVKQAHETESVQSVPAKPKLNMTDNEAPYLLKPKSRALLHPTNSRRKKTSFAPPKFSPSNSEDEKEDY